MKKKAAKKKNPSSAADNLYNTIIKTAQKLEDLLAKYEKITAKKTPPKTTVRKKTSKPRKKQSKNLIRD